MNILRTTAAAITATLLLGTGARADDVADFYRGKRINLVIGYGTGGGYDTYARLLARFIGKNLPGNPNVIAQNMPGAGSRGAANWLFNVAPRDGTAIAMLSQSTPVDQALGAAGIQFDARRFNWIGNMVVVNNILFVWAQTGVRSIEDARHKPLAIGSTGASSPSVLYPQVSNNLLGTKFRIVSGYPGGGDINLAVERREVDGRGSDSWASLKANSSRWLNERLVNILFQIGPRREVDLPDVPLWRELGQTDEQREILDILSGDIAVGRPILTAPGVPADRVRALRKAFDDTMRDPQFIESAAKANMYLNPMAGEELQEIAGRIASPSPAVIEKVRDAIKVKDVQERQR
ncbi:MAG TPA: tripartite tricarboxylate transporter substrate-binding protein [Xanthobacteraceae bacterium]|jgi:tripartite-type tricarboxylate transporter receptor subunit TctC|nr:tripartite tricarboxylate transporter substrate-binding protein [Xanthobacteraceae bacterium]